MRTFSLDEAQTMLPVVEALLDRAIRARDESMQLEEKMATLKVRIFHSGGLAVNVNAVYKDASELATHREAASQVMEELTSIGVQVKDLDRGLLDFPCTLDGEVVLLCWQRGEAQIAHWHTVEAGFAGRQKVDARFRRNSQVDRPN